jgi:YjbE family integral membrane protein
LETEILSSIFTIIIIDIILGGDNAIVIALACRNLPKKNKDKAIFLGTSLAILVRVLLTVLVVYLLKIPFLLLIGGLLLIIISYKLITNHTHHGTIKGEATLWGAIKTIVFADLIMGLDNVLAIAGASEGDILLVIIGLLVSVPIIIWGSKLILHLMELFPFLIYLGSSILAFTAGKMIVSEEKLLPFFISNPELEPLLILLIVLGTTFIGWLTNKYQEAQ